MYYHYIPDFLTNEVWWNNSMSAFERLTHINWERREDAPRYEYWCNVYDQPYTYGQGRGERTYEGKVTPWLVARIAHHLSEADIIPEDLRASYEGCFLNRYENGRDWLGWHSDDDPFIDHTKPIAVVTLYENPTDVRSIQIRDNETAVIDTIPLKHGSAFFMLPGAQFKTMHRVPKCGYNIGPRMSLTYRGLIKK